MVYLKVASLSYRFMDVFSKSGLLFPLTLAASIISSMLIWQTNCKFLQSIFKAHRWMVNMFKFLKI